jgi:glyoxylase-like metal-dependent hydrolase (beta-lactamase superfamily II)
MLEAPLNSSGSRTRRFKFTGKTRTLYLGRGQFQAQKVSRGVLFKAMSPFFRFKSVEPNMILQENDKVGRLTVIHTPRHTPGSVSLYDPERKVLFVGDTIRFVN